ncbi:hypothetical protein AB9M62_21325 [Bacillales bacterium AN1005]
MTSYPLDGPFPELPELEEIKGHQSRTKLIGDLATTKRRFMIYKMKYEESEKGIAFLDKELEEA